MLLLCNARGPQDHLSLFGIPAAICNAEAYKSLSSCWAGRIYGATHPHLQTGAPDDLAAQTIEEFATKWARAITTECKGQNSVDFQEYCLVGASLGGLLAYEVAVAAQSLGAPPPRRLFLVDPSAPSFRLEGITIDLRETARHLAMMTVLSADEEFDPPRELFDVAGLAISLAEFRACHLGYPHTVQAVEVCSD